MPSSPGDRPLPRSTGALCTGSPHAGMEALLGAADAVGCRRGACRARGRVRRARARARHRLRGRAGAGAAAVVLVARRRHRVARCARHPHAPVPRPLPRRRRDRHPRPLRRPPLPRGDVPAARRARSASSSPRSTSRAWSLPDPDGRLGACGREAARRRRRLPRPRCTRSSATPGAAAALLGAIGALDAAGRCRDRRLRRRSSDRRGDHRRRRRCPARRPSAHAIADGTPVSYADAAPGPRPARRRRRDGADGRAAGERACSCAAPTRCSACSAPAASTAARSTRRRRSTRTASSCGGAKFELVAARPTRHACTRSWSTRRCRHRSSRRCRSRWSTSTTARG